MIELVPTRKLIPELLQVTNDDKIMF